VTPDPSLPGTDVEQADGLVDGRIARGLRTRRRVAEALVALLEDGNADPTAKQIASRAGVSLRLVFHHFDDLDDLYRSVAAMQAERHWNEPRRRLAVTFAPEIGAAGGGGSDLLEALDLVASWEAWDRLRSLKGLSPTAARRRVTVAMAALLAAAAPSAPPGGPHPGAPS
jgi:AcrR family transcriptional regulator